MRCATKWLVVALVAGVVSFALVPLSVSGQEKAQGKVPHIKAVWAENCLTGDHLLRYPHGVNMVNICASVDHISHERIYRTAGSIYVVGGGDIKDETHFKMVGTFEKDDPDADRPVLSHVNTETYEPGTYTVVVVVCDLLSQQSVTKTAEFIIE
jgi:hypothetical protein